MASKAGTLTEKEFYQSAKEYCHAREKAMMSAMGNGKMDMQDHGDAEHERMMKMTKRAMKRKK